MTTDLSQNAPQTAITPEFVQRVLHQSRAHLPKANIAFSNIISDSRKVIPGSLFVALKGDKFDGHSFIQDAITQGAHGVLCRKGSVNIHQNQDICIFAVEDPLVSYRQIAAAWRKEFSIPIVAVAGSAGKTTTKELLAAILSGKWSHVLKTERSHNGFIGIPMTLLELQSKHEVAVIEVGIDEIGAMQQHIALVNPYVAVLTTIGPEHLETLKDVPTVAREEGIALSYVARSGGIVAINLDDPWIKPHFVTLREGRRVSFSLLNAEKSSQENHLSGLLSQDGKTLEFEGMNLPPTRVELPLQGKHNATNLLAAISVAAALGLTTDEIKKGLSTFKGAEGRSEIRELSGATRIICDYYNAQPMSMTAGFELLAQNSGRGGKANWACLADMLELGPEEERFHRELAPKLLELRIQNILLYGPRMVALENELRRRGFAGTLAHFSSHSALASALTEKVQPGDTVLIKGSRGMKMEEVWKLLESFIQSHWSTPVDGKNPVPHT